MKILTSILALLFFISSCGRVFILKKDNINSYRVVGGNNFKHGLWIEEDSSQIMKITRYKLGKKHGREVCFDLKMNSHTIGYYKKGNKDGLFRKYWNDGVLMWEYLYSGDTVKRYKIYRTYSPKID